MAKKKKVAQGKSSSGAVGKVRGADAASSDWRLEPQPPVPRRLAGYSVGDDAVLVFQGGRVDLELTGPIVVQGGTPVLVTEEFEGRSPKTALDAAGLRTASLSAVVKGAGAQRIHDALSAYAVTRNVCLLYGPMIGTGQQGMAWRMGEPQIDAGSALFNGDATLRRFMVELTLNEWQPLRSLAVRGGSRVSKGNARKNAKFVADDVNDAARSALRDLR